MPATACLPAWVDAECSFPVLKVRNTNRSQMSFHRLTWFLASHFKDSNKFESFYKKFVYLTKFIVFLFSPPEYIYPIPNQPFFSTTVLHPSGYSLGVAFANFAQTINLIDLGMFFEINQQATHFYLNYQMTKPSISKLGEIYADVRKPRGRFMLAVKLGC